jgi:AcrR family transcriptional regulator
MHGFDLWSGDTARGGAGSFYNPGVTSSTASSRAIDSDTLVRIVAAARECFARDGVGKTWMATVAGQVGIARQTLYAFVAGRRELIELALIARSREIMDAVRSQAGGLPHEMPEALVEFMAIMVELTRDDPEFRNLSGGLSRNDAFPFLTGPTPMRDIVLDGLGPLFVRADSERLLRDDRTHLDMAGWVQTVLGPLATRGDLTPETLRETLRAYVLPALLRK